ncbi:MAG: L-aspartate oxidase [uncultured Chloroflexi bacterium]|uniref:L-aspartate oxidase n=1 Tax=uncultured Chloroflexota bacterium TaxID=166587 RepID=A0A6J4K7S5_9CHLR|nr:MAG: L-aspartate oxidase [uncultured Chloroflexota bacterium]
MLLSARAIAQAALFREESRGAHFRSDFPDTDAALDGMHLVHDGRRGGWRLTTLPDALGRSEPAEVGR